MVRAAVALLLLAAACDPTPCGLRACDIREPACQRRAAAAASCLRARPTPEIPVEVITQDEYLQRSLAGAAATDRAAFAAHMEGLALLGLVPPGLTVEDVVMRQAWAGAIYDPGIDRITVVHRGEPLASPDWVAVLVHEFVHAQQDAEMDLGAFFDAHARTFDASLAARAMLEGEASLVDDLASVAAFGATEGEVRWRRVLEHWSEGARQFLPRQDAPLLVSDLYFVYPFGEWYVHQAWTAGGWAGVDRLFTDRVPASARQVLAGLGADEPGAGPWTEDLSPMAMPLLPERFKLIAHFDLGAWLLETFLVRQGHPHARRIAAHLRTDRATIQQDRETGGVVTTWRLRFSEEVWAAQLQAHELPDLTVDRLGRDLLIVGRRQLPQGVGEVNATTEFGPPPLAAPPRPRAMVCPLPARRPGR